LICALLPSWRWADLASEVIIAIHAVTESKPNGVDFSANLRFNAMYIDNPLIKRQNKDWKIDLPTLARSISPPTAPRVKRQKAYRDNNPDEAADEVPQAGSDVQVPASAAVEAGKINIRDHLRYFTDNLSAHVQTPYPAYQPRLPIIGFHDLYKQNVNPAGHHFVIHQHDHPVAGVHYDLRLQFSKTSSISFAIMYGMPGNPNSKRLGRNATETRVHNVWVSLIMALVRVLLVNSQSHGFRSHDMMMSHADSLHPKSTVNTLMPYQTRTYQTLFTLIATISRAL
jgi:hypothetical protein